MVSVRVPAVAGRFYPADPVELSAAVQRYLRDGVRSVRVSRSPKAIIVPHAGYRYSGDIAGSAVALLQPSRAVIRRVVIIGPAHRLPVAGLALPAESTFATPLGEVPVDTKAVDEIAGFDFVHVVGSAHAREHALEVHLPFLQSALDCFSIVPLLAGDMSATHMRDLINHLWGGDETRFVISSDLSHFHDYDTARRIDAETSFAIERLAADRIGAHQACGWIAIQGLLMAAHAHHLRGHIVDVRNSGDTAGNRVDVVGYGAYAFAE